MTRMQTLETERADLRHDQAIKGMIDGLAIKRAKRAREEALNNWQAELDRREAALDGAKNDGSPFDVKSIAEARKNVQDIRELIRNDPPVQTVLAEGRPRIPRRLRQPRDPRRRRRDQELVKETAMPKKNVIDRLVDPALKADLEEQALETPELLPTLAAIGHLKSAVAEQQAQVRPPLKGDYAAVASQVAEREAANAPPATPQSRPNTRPETPS